MQSNTSPGSPSRATRGAGLSRSGALVTLLRSIGAWLLPWAALILLWYGSRHSGLIKASLVPSPEQVLITFWVQLTEFGLLRNIAASVMRVVVGLAVAVLLAIPVGFALGWYRPVARFFDPLISFFRALPPIALIPLVIVYFGIGEFAKLIVLFYAGFFASVIVIYEGISQISPIYVRVAKTLGATDGEIFRHVIVPLAVPHILTATRVALGICWGTLVASELIAAQVGLGAMIQNAGSYFKFDEIYVGIICIGAFALAMDFTLRAATRRLVSWQDRIIT